jgi:hypothetical protein
MAQYFDRYSGFRVNNEVKPLPGIKIPEASTDKVVIYKEGNSRLDKISNTYYNNPYSGWLILLANPQFGGLEFNIPDSTPLRVPFPFESAVSRYSEQVKNYKILYGE